MTKGVSTGVDSLGSRAILSLENVKTYFPIRRGFFRRHAGDIRAVDGVTIELRAGETLGLVGESGCGKSTLVQSILRLVEPTSGAIRLNVNGWSCDIATLDQRGLRRARRAVQLIFQDAAAAMNPRFSVKEVIAEPLRINNNLCELEIDARVCELLKAVGLHPMMARRSPGALSGGQRQRIGIARALALDPEILIADEPVSALDVSVQSQILNLLKDLKKECGLTYLFIAHNLDAVRYMSDRIAVMYLGRIVELGARDDIYRSPAHPYTESLMAAIPALEMSARDRERHILAGDLPDPAAPPSGCPFHTRCPYCVEACKSEIPKLSQVSADGGRQSGHLVACIRANELKLAGRA